MMTNELRGKIEKDLYEGMSSAASVYWRTAYNVVEKYIDEIDDDDDTFINEISMITAVEFARVKKAEYDKMFETKEES